jgi:hypothetical protein
MTATRDRWGLAGDRAGQDRQRRSERRKGHRRKDRRPAGSLVGHMIDDVFGAHESHRAVNRRVDGRRTHRGRRSAATDEGPACIDPPVRRAASGSRASPSPRPRICGDVPSGTDACAVGVGYRCIQAPGADEMKASVPRRAGNSPRAAGASLCRGHDRAESEPRVSRKRSRSKRARFDHSYILSL